MKRMEDLSVTHKEQLIQRTREYLDSQNWHYELMGEENGHFIIRMGLHNRLQRCTMLIVVNEKEIQTAAVSPISATEDVYADVVEYITRANHGLKIGKFEFDYEDGEVSYQSSLSCIQSVPDIKDVERVVDMPFLMLERYGNGLVKNLMGFGNPKEDIREVEG